MSVVEIVTQGARPRTVVAGDGERPVRAHDPGHARGQQADDEQERARVAEHGARTGQRRGTVLGDGAAVNGEDVLAPPEQARAKDRGRYFFDGSFACV